MTTAANCRFDTMVVHASIIAKLMNQELSCIVIHDWDKTRVIGVTSTNSALLSDIFRYFRLYVREKRLLFVEPLDIKEVPSLS